MKETKFIEQNKAKWAELEALLGKGRNNPDRLSELFVQTTDDLAYSRTFYANRSVRVYLNGLAQRMMPRLYRSRRLRWENLGRFWQKALPQALFESRRELLLSFCIFIVAFFIGILSTAYDDTFPRIILGDEYVDQTIQNIEAGDPMAIYKQQEEGLMSIRITFNNIRVAFLLFALGAFFSMGTVAVLIFNGIMVGAFQYFFYAHGVFWDSFFTIWVHGTLEISVIIIAGAAGLTMGRGLVIPGSFSRGQAFQLSARRGIVIMLGIVPVFILAGFIEGYLTRHTELSYFVRGAIILFSLCIILGYYLLYPMLRASRGYFTGMDDVRLEPKRATAINFGEIRFGGKIVADMLLLVRQFFPSLTATVTLCTIFTFIILQSTKQLGIETISFASLHDSDNLRETFFQSYRHFKLLFQVQEHPILYGIYGCCIGLLIARPQELLFRSIHPKLHPSTKLNLKALQTIGFTLLVGLSFFIPYAPPLLVFLTILISVPIVGMAMLYEDKNIGQSISHLFVLMKGKWMAVLQTHFIVLLLAWLLFCISTSQEISRWVEIVVGLFIGQKEQIAQVVTHIHTLIAYFILYSAIAFIALNGGLLYFSLRELQSAETLQERISQIGIKHQVYGFEQE